MTPAEKELNRIIGRHKLIHKRLRRQLITVAAHYADYEPFAQELDLQDNQDRLLLWSLLDEEGVYSPEHIDDIARLGQLFMSLHPRPRGNPQQAALRYREAAHQTLSQPLFDNGRFLGWQALEEASKYSFLGNSHKRIQHFGWDRACQITDDLIRKKLEGPVAARVMNLFVLAHRLKHYRFHAGGTGVDGLSLTEAYRLLRDMDFAPTPDRGVDVSLPERLTRRLGMRLRVFANARQDPRFIVAFRIEIQRHLTVVVALSRSTGELMPSDIRLLPLSLIFDRVGEAGHYEALKRLCTFAALQCALEGRLPERTYAQLTPVPPPVRIVEPEPEPKIVDPNADIPEHLRTWQPHQPEPEALPDIEEEDAQTSETVRGIRRSGNLTWRKIMSALRRLGVTVDFGGKHPKLRKGDLSTPFLNPHGEEDIEHNRRVLRRALADLCITEAEFEAAR